MCHVERLANITSKSEGFVKTVVELTKPVDETLLMATRGRDLEQPGLGYMVHVRTHTQSRASRHACVYRQRHAPRYAMCASSPLARPARVLTQVRRRVRAKISEREAPCDSLDVRLEWLMQCDETMAGKVFFATAV